MEEIKAGAPFSFPGALSGKVFEISFNGKNFVMSYPAIGGKKARKQALGLQQAGTIISNALNDKK